MSRATTRWWWVRHGPVVKNNSICVGHLDLMPDLSDHETITALSEALPESPVWVCTPLTRTRATLDAIRAHRTGEQPEPIVEPGMAEQHFGEWQGMTYDAVRAETGEAAWRTPSTIQPPGGERYDELYARVSQAVDRIGASHGGSDIVVVGHAGSIRAALAKALDLDLDRALSLSIAPLSLTCMTQHDERAWSVQFVNRLA